LNLRKNDSFRNSVLNWNNFVGFLHIFILLNDTLSCFSERFHDSFHSDIFSITSGISVLILFKFHGSIESPFDLCFAGSFEALAQLHDPNLAVDAVSGVNFKNQNLLVVEKSKVFKLLKYEQELLCFRFKLRLSDIIQKKFAAHRVRTKIKWLAEVLRLNSSVPGEVFVPQRIDNLLFV